MNSTLANLTNRMMIGNYDIPLIVVMRPNPQNFNKATTKMNATQYTNSGWVTNHFGNELDIIRIEGYTSAKVREPFSKSNKSSNIIGSLTDSFTGKNNSANYGPIQWADIDRFLMKLEQLVKLDKERLGNLTEMLTSTIGTGNIASIISNKISNPLTGGRQDFIASQTTTASQTNSFIIYQYVYYAGYFNSFNYAIDVNDPSRYKYSLEFIVTQSSQDWLTKNLITNFPEARVLNLFTQFKSLSSYTTNLISNADQLLKGIFL